MLPPLNESQKTCKTNSPTFNPILLFGILTGTACFNQLLKNLIEDGLRFEKHHSYEVGDNKAVTQHQISKVILNQHNGLCQSVSQQFGTATAQQRQKRNEATICGWIDSSSGSDGRCFWTKSFEPNNARERFILFFSLHEIQPQFQRHISSFTNSSPPSLPLPYPLQSVFAADHLVGDL